MSTPIFIYGAYALFTLLVILGFFVFESKKTAVCSFLLGWLLLPNAIYPDAVITEDFFTYEVLGLLLPANLGLVTKATVVPVVILIASLVFDLQRWRAFRPTVFDITILLFCLMPALLLPFTAAGAGTGIVNVFYLASSWGGSWLLGRLFVTQREDRALLLRMIALTGLVLLPFALLEGLAGPQIYTHVYGQHPFLLTGADRYLGFRPLGFMEDGNQYGMWIAMSALAAIALAFRGKGEHALPVFIAPVLTLAALASQSVGAIFLLLCGVIVLLLPARVFRVVFVAGVVMLAVAGGLFVTNIVPLEYIAYNTAFGQEVVDFLRGLDRNSFAWRVHRDVEALTFLHQELFTGYGVWDWWRPLESHPWGLPLLIMGQFGAIALLLSLVAILGPPVTVLLLEKSGRSALAIIVLLAGVDAMLNSFLFTPAIVMAGALAGRPQAGQVTVRESRWESSQETVR